MYGHRTKRLTLVAATILVGVLGVDKMCFSNELAEVQLGTDLKRVVVRARESIKDYSSFALHRPSRLVIDIPGCGAGDLHRIDPPGKGGSLAVRVSATRSGARVVFDFKRGAVPGHRIRRMDNCLVVFFEDWSVPATASSSRHLPMGEERPRSVHRTIGKPLKAGFRLPEHGRHRSGKLSIESAEVVDGLIVLHVAERKTPERLYRIELGVNLDSLGFDSAGIRPDFRRAGAKGVQGNAEPAREASPREDGGDIRQITRVPTGQWDLMENEN